MRTEDRHGQSTTIASCEKTPFMIGPRCVKSWQRNKCLWHTAGQAITAELSTLCLANDHNHSWTEQDRSRGEISSDPGFDMQSTHTIHRPQTGLNIGLRVLTTSPSPPVKCFSWRSRLLNVLSLSISWPCSFSVGCFTYCLWYLCDHNNSGSTISHARSNCGAMSRRTKKNAMRSNTVQANRPARRPMTCSGC